MFYHNSIRRYTLAVLDFFNQMEVQYENDGQIVTKSVPIRYKTREKLLSIDKGTEQVLSGNTNVLPRAFLELTGLSPETDRQTSKYLKINRNRTSFDEANYQWNSVSYTFSFKVSVLCRGMNEVSQIIEQMAPKFNPNVAIDVRDAEDESESTRVTLQLGGIDFQVPEYDENSANVCTVSFDCTLSGFLFQPIKEYSVVREFRINLSTPLLQNAMTSPVKDSIPNFDYQSEISFRDDLLVIEDLRLSKEENRIKVSFRSNSEERPKITFVSETCDILRQNFDTCEVSKDSGFDVLAKLELNGQYWTVFGTF